MEPAPTPATKTASSDEKNEERKVFLPVRVQYCATSPGASQGPVSCEVSESGHCGHSLAQLQGVLKSHSALLQQVARTAGLHRWKRNRPVALRSNAASGKVYADTKGLSDTL